ncbi:CLUMA_CG012243, isoform A [Clunio marinus]|uniref:CLUMA_CG012243, isoform A n=1 Tax=Clunio marinus TaxID=568069 RepID=A0A1J1IFN9_9DIPT|nr:CLUMA_CG012243, isoform A [Clunio marinus]
MKKKMMPNIPPVNAMEFVVIYAFCRCIFHDDALEVMFIFKSVAFATIASKFTSDTENCVFSTDKELNELDDGSLSTKTEYYAH